MPEFTTSFFEYHRPILTEDEQKAINAQLKSLYHGKESCLYSKESPCFEESREQLLALLDYYISIAPHLTLLKSYKTNIQRLSKDSDFIDLYITFNVAKKKLEQFLLFFKEKYKTFDTAKFNSYVVTACYQGAYSNLVQALGISTLSDLTDLKQAYLMDLATHYLREGRIKYQSVMEPHYAMGLVNYLAHSYGVERVEDPRIPPFKEIVLKGFTRYIEKHFNVAGFIQLVSQCPELQLPHEIVDSAESNYKDKYNQITIFFKWLGEKTEPLHELQRLYQQESDEENYTYYRLIPKQGFRLSIESLLARYLEKAGHLKGVSIKIDKGSLVDNGETLVRLTDEGYQTLSQEDIIALLNEAENNKELPLGSLLKQLNTETLFERYSTLDSSPNEPVYVQALLKQPTLPQAIAKKIYASIPKEDTLKHKQQLTEYLLTHPCADFSVDLFTSLCESVSLTEEEQLHYFQFAIENNLATQAGFLLKTYPNVFNNNPFSFLSLAIEHSSLDALEILLKNSAVPINIVNSQGETLLHIAVDKGNVSALDKLLQLGVPPNQADNLGRTSLHNAAEQGHVNAVEKLIEQRAADIINQVDDEGWTPLNIAAQYGHVNVVKTLKNAQLNQATNQQNTPLHIAAQCNHVDVVTTLLQFGADPNLANNEGYTALHCAAYKGYVDVVEKLIDSRATDINPVGDNEWTPLHMAAQEGHVNVVKTLKKAQLNRANNQKNTPLNIAAQHNHVDVVTTLLQLGADPNLANNEGWAPIHSAAQKGYVDVVKTLEKADLNQANNKKNTPLNIAAQHNHVDVVTTLLQFGADPNLANNDGRTPLHSAALYGYVNVVKALKEGGADHNQIDKLGKTPADIAAQKGHFEILETLHECGGKFNLQKLFEKLSKSEKEKFIMWLVVKLPTFVQNNGDFLLIINELSEPEKTKFATRMLESLVARKEYKIANSIVELFPQEQSVTSSFISLFCKKRSQPTLFKDKATPLAEQYLTQLNQDIRSLNKSKGFGFFKCSSIASAATRFKKSAQNVGVVPNDIEKLHKYKII